MANDPAAVRLDRVSRSFRSGSAEVQALREVSLSIAAGERVAVLGKSGSGKSTLLHLLGGLDRPDAGRVTVAGLDLGGLSPAGLAGYRLSVVGVVFQSFHLIATRTALQNVEMPLVFAGVPPAARRAKAAEMLARVGLAGRLHHRPAELSGGECQRVAIARALVNEPALLLADEPTGNLDSATAAGIMELLLAHTHGHDNPRTLVLVTHDEDLARRTADRTVRLSDGRLTGEGDDAAT